MTDASLSSSDHSMFGKCVLFKKLPGILARILCFTPILMTECLEWQESATDTSFVARLVLFYNYCSYNSRGSWTSLRSLNMFRLHLAHFVLSRHVSLFCSSKQHLWYDLTQNEFLQSLVPSDERSSIDLLLCCLEVHGTCMILLLL